MNTNIGNIASVQTGYSFRTRLKNESSGNLNVLTYKSLDFEKQVLIDNYYRIQHKTIDNKYLLDKNDILFAAKGMTSKAILLPSLKEPTTALSLFYIIRITSKNILPAYLVWHLNRSRTQHYLNSMSTGTAIRNIARNEVLQLPISIPSIPKQKQIIAADDLLRQIAQTQENLLNLYKQKTNKILIDSLRNIV